MKYLVTGASGFIGSHLVKKLADMGSSVNAWGKNDVSSHKNVALKTIDIRDADLVFQEIDLLKPNIIFHFAAQSFPKLSWESPHKTLETNIIGVTNILNALTKIGLKCRLLIAGSSAQYKVSESAITEESEQAPRDPYALSKFCADKLAMLYADKYHLDIIRFRPFYVIGPGKKGDAASDLATKVIYAHRNNLLSINVGNVNIARDYLDIGDAVNALSILATKGQGGESYNICSGQGYRIESMLEHYISLSGKYLSYKIDPTLVRKDEPPAIVGDPSKLLKLGWKKEIEIRETLKNIYHAALAEKRASSTGRIFS